MAGWGGRAGEDGWRRYGDSWETGNGWVLVEAQLEACDAVIIILLLLLLLLLLLYSTGIGVR